MQRRPQRHAASKQAQRNRARRRERVLAVNEKTRTVDSITGTTEIEAAALLTSDENSFTYKSFGAPPLTLRKCKKKQQEQTAGIGEEPPTQWRRSKTKEQQISRGVREGGKPPTTKKNLKHCSLRCMKFSTSSMCTERPALFGASTASTAQVPVAVAAAIAAAVEQATNATLLSSVLPSLRLCLDRDPPVSAALLAAEHWTGAPVACTLRRSSNPRSGSNRKEPAAAWVAAAVLLRTGPSNSCERRI